MEIILPTDCGNSPRLLLVGEFVVNWACGHEEAVAPWLADDATWKLIGGAEDDAAAGGRIPWAPITADRIEILSTVTHGRLAACDGFLTSSAGRVDFAHMLRFTGAAKSARIAEMRTYLHQH